MADAPRRARGPDPRAFGLSDEDLRTLGYSVGATPRVEDGGDVEDRVDGRRDAEENGGYRTLDAPRRMWAATLLVLSAAAWVAHPARHLPDPVPANAPSDVFSSARAMAELGEVARGPRPTGSPENARVREYLHARLERLGAETEIQTRTVASGAADGGRVVSARVQNVVGRFRGSGTGAPVAIMSPYDGPPLSEGAGRGAGVAVVLEAVRAWSAGPTRRSDLVVVFTDGDLLGELGSRAFLEEHRWADDVRVAVSTVGHDGAGVVYPMGEAGLGTSWWRSAPGSDPGSTSLATALRSTPLSSVPDRGSVRSEVARLDLVSVGDLGSVGGWADTRGGVSEATLQQMGLQLLAAARPGATGDATSVGSRSVSAWVPWLGAVAVPVDRVWVFPVGAGAGLAILLLVSRWRGATRRGTLIGVAMGVAVVASAGWLTRVGFDLLAGYHPESDALSTLFYRQSPHRLAVVSAVASLLSLGYGLARRWCRADELCVGALVVPVAVSPWIAWSAPSAAVGYHLPVLVGMLSCLLLVAAGPSKSRKVGAWLVLVALGTATLVATVPGYVLAVGMWTTGRPEAIGMLAALASLLLLPLGEWTFRPSAWPTAGVGAAVTFGAIGLALPLSGSSATHPQPSTLIYVADTPVRDPITSMLPDEMRVDSGGPRRMEGQWLTTSGPGEDWARSWAVTPPAADPSAGPLLLPRRSGYLPIGAGPVSELVAPVLDVVGSRVSGDHRFVTLSIAPGLPGEMMGVVLDQAVGAVVSVGGEALGPGPRTHTVEHWGLPVGGSLEVGVRVPREAERLEVTLVEHHLRPREVLGAWLFERPDSLVPHVTVGSDRVIQRTVHQVTLQSMP